MSSTFDKFKKNYRRVRVIEAVSEDCEEIFVKD